jgi:hypothetical protein
VQRTLIELLDLLDLFDGIDGVDELGSEDSNGDQLVRLERLIGTRRGGWRFEDPGEGWSSNQKDVDFDV